MTKFSFWIIPENDVYQEFNKIITKYSDTYTSPKFVPHMTIHGVVESTDKKVVETIHKAVNNIKKFEVEIGAVEFSTTYFQCIFARIKTNAKLFNTHLTIKNAFNINDNNVFMPHASLVYGDFDMETREKIIQEIEIKNNSFMASKITIVRADTSNPKDWAIVDQVPLR